MGAGDGDGDGTGPKTNEMNPCNESPGLGPLPKHPQISDTPQQVSGPANYAIAGKILLAVAGAFAGVLLALVALHLYNSTRRRRLGAGGDDEDRRDGHRFHVECIDAWFRGNATCPLCRADVVVAPPDAAAAPSAPPEGGAPQPEVRIDVAGDAVVAPANGGTTVAPVVIGRLHSGRDLDKARRVFASTRFSSF